MVKYIVKRILWLVPVILGVTIILFTLQALVPGDPADLALGDSASAEDKTEWRAQYGLDDPIIVQYGRYMYNLFLKGDFGKSYRTGSPVVNEIASRWPTTFVLALGSTAAASVIGILFGIISALCRGKWIDNVLRVFSMLGISLPQFWFALLMILQFSVNMKWFPVSGLYGPRYWVLPIATLSILGSATILRISRSSVLDCVAADYVDTARAKGQKQYKIISHHILRNALIPIITSIGILFSTSLGGSMVIEQIFGIPGLGDMMITAINNRDYSMLRAGVLITAITAAVINLLIDILYAAFDPRVKERFKHNG